jgi:hypothetical protein
MWPFACETNVKKEPCETLIFNFSKVLYVYFEVYISLLHLLHDVQDIKMQIFLNNLDIFLYIITSYVYRGVVTRKMVRDLWNERRLTLAIQAQGSL